MDEISECYFCRQPAAVGKRHCGRSECQAWDDAISAEFSDQHYRQQREAVWHLLTRWGQTSEHYYSDGPWRRDLIRRARLAAYAAKALFCLFMRWGPREGNAYGVHLGDWDMTDGDGWHWVEVGKGWGNWWAYVDSDWPERGY
jgi:hypothetical protein